MNSRLTAILISTVFLLSGGCAGEPRSDLAARVGSASLSRADVARAVPGGLSADDSVRFVSAYVNAWVDDRLIEEVAAANISDMRDIDEMVSDYRRQLIMAEYRRRMMESRSGEIVPQDSVAAYYEEHHASLRAQSPYVRGLYVRVRNSHPSIAGIRKLYRSVRQADVEKLEKMDFGPDGLYEYFRSSWTEWRALAARIPLDFGPEPDSWPTARRAVADSVGGFTYFLDISDCIRPGDELPLELAAPLIREKLLNRYRIDFDRELRRELRERALASGSLEIY